MEKGHRRSKGMSTLEKCLIFILVALTGVCIAMVVLYFTQTPDSTHGDGEYTVYGKLKSVAWIIHIFIPLLSQGLR